jgi:hypothetical protein
MIRNELIIRQNELLDYYLKSYEELGREEFLVAGMASAENIEWNLFRECETNVQQCRGITEKDIDELFSNIEKLYKIVGDIIGNVFTVDVVKTLIKHISTLSRSNGNINAASYIYDTAVKIHETQHLLVLYLMRDMDILKIRDTYYRYTEISNIARLIYLNISTITSLLDTDDKISDSKGIYKNLRKLFIGSIAKMIKNIKDYEAFKVLANTEFQIDGKTTIKEILVRNKIIDNDFNIIASIYTDEDIKNIFNIIDEVKKHINLMVEVENKFDNIMKNFPEALSDEFYLNTTDGDYNELEDLWPNHVWATNIEALESMRDILDKAIEQYNIYSELLRK